MILSLFAVLLLPIYGLFMWRSGFHWGNLQIKQIRQKAKERNFNKKVSPKLTPQGA